MYSKEIITCIYRLLFRNECVILPGFGGFITNNIPANYISETGMFYPPSKAITFNSRLAANDGLLINYFSQRYNFSYEEAKGHISAFAGFAGSELDKGNRVVFDGVGAFVKKSGAIVFSPDNSVNLLIEAFGLPVLQLPVEKQPLAYPVFEAPGQSGRMLSKALMVLPFLLLIALFPLKINKIQFDTVNPANFVNINSIIKHKDSLRNNPVSISEVIDKLSEIEYALFYVDSKVSESKNTAETDIDSVRADTTTVETTALVTREPETEKAHEPGYKVTSQKNNYIIAGSFVEMKRAEVFCNEMKRKGFSPEIISRDSKLRISIGSYSDSSKASEALQLFRKEHPDMPVWLLMVK